MFHPETTGAGKHRDKEVQRSVFLYKKTQTLSINNDVYRWFAHRNQFLSTFCSNKKCFFFLAHDFLLFFVSRLQPESLGAVGLWRGDVRAALQTLRTTRGRRPVQDLDRLRLSHARRPPHSKRRRYTMKDEILSELLLNIVSFQGLLMLLYERRRALVCGRNDDSNYVKLKVNVP